MELQVTTTETISRETKSCPFCAEQILLEAKKCKHCGEHLEALVANEVIAEVVAVPERKPSVVQGRRATVMHSSFPFMTRQVSGTLEVCGKSTWLAKNEGKAAYERYSILQIGDKKFHDVYIRDHLGTFLDLAVGEEVQVLLINFLFKNYAIGVRTHRGAEKGPIIPIFALLLSVLLVPVYGLGFFFIASNIARLVKLARL